MLSVVIRTKNQAKALAFLLKNLRERYADDVDEIIVLDNLSTDSTAAVVATYQAKLVSIAKFSYGESANLAAESASNTIVVLFSAHSYPVSPDFFKLIKEKFKGREHDLAGLRCLHNSNDFTSYINGLSSTTDYNNAGLIFAGSAFNKKVWEQHPFRNDVPTFEDKEWSKRVLQHGFAIEFVPSIFCYSIHRTKAQLFFRAKNEVIGSYQLHHTSYTFPKAIKNLLHSIYKLTLTYFVDLYYAVKRFIFMLGFLLHKPEQFK